MKNECLSCYAYEVLEELLKEGYNLKDALHVIIGDVSELAYDEGRLEVLASINKLTEDAIEDIIEDEECDCCCSC